MASERDLISVREDERSGEVKREGVVVDRHSRNKVANPAESNSRPSVSGRLAVFMSLASYKTSANVEPNNS